MTLAGLRDYFATIWSVAGGRLQVGETVLVNAAGSTPLMESGAGRGQTP